MTKEADARIIIDRKLREAEWNIEDKTQVATEEPAADGRADYLLLDGRARPLSVVEAKRFRKDPTTAKARSLEYARSLKSPFIFLSNGEATYFWDYEHGPERLVQNFFTRADLERLASLQMQRRPLSSVPMPEQVQFGSELRTVRECHRKCLAAVDRALEQARRRLLIEMATGTGKTFAIALMLKRLFQAGWVQRVLFLADRIELARQAKEETFDIYLSEYPAVLLTGGRRSREGQITVGTLPTITSQLGPGGFSSGYFDLVITDECHRSIYSTYKHTLLHFDAIHIGLTATPNIGQYAFVNDTEKRLIRNTYEFFDCWNPLTEQGQPVFVYGILDGIRDKILADYDIFAAKTRITAEGIN
ncbi:MAG: DEAD/DEAH box helicase, partial [Verrucomicrobia bacterium]|nr:DEAD/DEAH box helicase [Verrucomicrobiota bacterium]